VGARGLEQHQAVGRKTLHLVGLQAQVGDGRGQGEALQVFVQQALQPVELAAGAAQADGVCGGGLRIVAAAVVGPTQGEGADPGLHAGQPGAHLLQQALGGKLQAWRGVHPAGQFQPGVEAGRQGDPNECHGQLAKSLIERTQHVGAEAPAQAAARQLAHLAQGHAAQAAQGGRVARDGAQGGQGQGAQGEIQRGSVRVSRPARQRQCTQGRVPHGTSLRLPTQRARPHPRPQGLAPTKQSLAGGHFQHHGVFQQGHARGELQGPPGQMLRIQRGCQRRFQRCRRLSPRGWG
jgi:hypothetical protein